MDWPINVQEDQRLQMCAKQYIIYSTKCVKSCKERDQRIKRQKNRRESIQRAHRKTVQKNCQKIGTIT